LFLIKDYTFEAASAAYKLYKINVILSSHL